MAEVRRLASSQGPGGPIAASRIALLEAIRDQGSIDAAAKAVRLSPKRAWDAVQALNNLFDRPVVVCRSADGSGGAARITELGDALIGVFRFVDAEVANDDHDGFLWSVSMKTSARNALAGKVESVTDGTVNAEVVLDIGDGQKIIAVVTRDSVDELGLRPGRRALALIKSSFVILVPGEGTVRTSARNCLTGSIVRRDDGAVNSEVTLELSPRRSLTATITRESVETLGLDVGVRASALIKASHVILAVEGP
jgi:molybdate transport system regulatory protein